MALESASGADNMVPITKPSPNPSPNPKDEERAAISQTNSSDPAKQDNSNAKANLIKAKDFIVAVARKLSAQPLQNSDPGVWGVLTAISKNARQRPQGGRVWEVSTRRSLRDDEVISFSNLIQKLYEVPRNPYSLDRRIWTPSCDGNFSVKSYYRMLSCCPLIRFQGAGLWKMTVPLRIKFFAWTLFKDRILTVDQLIRRGKDIPYCCVMCNMEEETAAHLLLHCQVAHDIWCAILKSFGSSWVTPGTLDLQFLMWSSVKMEGDLGEYWMTAVVAGFWSIWRKRNMRIFENKRWPVGMVIKSVRDLVWFWVTRGGNGLRYDSFTWDPG